jgi:hypothetical protein
MKSWNGHNDARVVPRRASAGTRFLTTVFCALVVIAGLDTVFPSLKHKYIPGQDGQPLSRPSYAARPFEWTQVRISDLTIQDTASVSYQMDLALKRNDVIVRNAVMHLTKRTPRRLLSLVWLEKTLTELDA